MVNTMYGILITLEIILITDIRQLISNSGVLKIQIDLKRLYSSPYQLLSCEAAHSVNISLFLKKLLALGPRTQKIFDLSSLP